MRVSIVTLGYVVASIAAGFAFPRLEYGLLPQSVHGMSVASAQALLSSAASGMMALTAIVFALVFVIVQYSGTAYSPRLVSWFTGDPLLFRALGVFMATFVYALSTLAWIDRNRSGYVPLFSTYIVFVLIVASMFALVQLVRRIGELQISSVLRLVGNAGRTVIESAFLPLDPHALETTPRTTLYVSGDKDPSQIVYYHGNPKAVVSIDLNGLTRLAQDADAVIILKCGVGDTLTEGLALAHIYGGKVHISQGAVAAALQLSYERSALHDPRYAMRILVDVAIKALSPAVNDPSTAVQAIDQIEDLLYRLLHRELGDGVCLDARGTLRVRYPRATWEDFLALAFDEIRVCGASQLQIMRRLRAALDELASAAASGPRADALRRSLHHLDATVQSSSLDALDRASALYEDRQGLGATR